MDGLAMDTPLGRTASIADIAVEPRDIVVSLFDTRKCPIARISVFVSSASCAISVTTEELTLFCTMILLILSILRLGVRF